MVSLSARLKRTSLPPLSLRTPPSPGARPPHHAQPTAAGSAMPSTNPRPSTAATVEADAEADETTIGDGETLWHGAPVFDAGYWHTKGGSELVQAKHAELHARVEALSIVCSGTEDSWHLECMTLSWPRVQVVDIEYDACQVQPDSLALQWLDMAQDRAWFPQARMYRLTARWAGCTEVFEHPLCGTLGAGLAARLALLDRLPPLTGDRAQEMRFYRYRALFLSSASFAMGTMSKTAAGVRAMNSYITYLFKTDIFAPVAVELIDAQPQHLQSVLAAINANTHNIAYDRMRSTTSTTALQSSLRRICFDMHNMAAGRDRIIFCAAHFPKLESLVVRHSPDFKLPHTDAMNLGVLFSLPWVGLVELQLPFISDKLAQTLQSKCPVLRYLHVLPDPRYERWTAYSQTFTPDGLHGLVVHWPAMRQLVVRHAFRQELPIQGTTAPPMSPSRLSFGSVRRSTLKPRASVLPLSPDSQSPTPKVESVPGLWPRESFSVHPKHRSLRVLRMPYLQLPFSVALEMLVSIPQLSILEFAPLLRDPTPPSLGIASTLRRRVSITPSPSQPQLNAPFAESSVVYQLGTTKHPLESMILHDACTTRYITTSWIQIMNTFLQLAAVTFVATSQEDVTIASRIKLFCARNDAAFAIETDDQSRTFQTCIDFTNTWSQAEGLISTAGAR
ncbi:hypothetical protein LPJ70_003726 [Coemansia sp. RSA 2708]|nr:hypothetical protein LPJ70_003726 [Coemansia sp. RSA 2708]